MSDVLYSVVLFFDACDEAVRGNVRSFLEQRYHITSEHMGAALDKGRLLIKRDSTLSDAQSIQQRIRIDGAVCRLKKQRQHRNHSGESPNGDSMASEASEPDGTIICPKCQTRQPACAECINCGIIFARIHKGPAPRKNRTEIAATPENRPEEGSSARPIRDFAGRYLPSFQALYSHLSRWRQEAVQWSRKPLNAMCSGAILVLTAFLLETFLIFLVKYLWFIYTATTVGERFIIHHPVTAEVIEHIVILGASVLAWDVVFRVLIFCLLLGVIAQFTHISRYYLDAGGFFMKAMWLLPSALAVAGMISRQDPMLSLFAAFLLVLPSALLLLPACLNLTRSILPEMGGILPEIIGVVARRGDVIAALKQRFFTRQTCNKDIIGHRRRS